MRRWAPRALLVSGVLGQVRCSVRAESSVEPGRGLRVQAALTDVLVRDRGWTLLRADGLWFEAPRLDLSELIDVTRAEARVGELVVQQDAQGWSVEGVRLGARGVDPADLSSRSTRPRSPPTIDVRHLDVRLGSVELRDQDEDSTAWVARALHLRSSTRFQLFSRDPLALELSGASDSVARSFHVSVSGDPVTIEPDLELALCIGGLNGGGLLALAPALVRRIDGSGWVDAFLVARARVTLGTGRPDPRPDGDCRSGCGRNPSPCADPCCSRLT